MKNRVECKVYSCLFNQASNCHKGVIFVKMEKHMMAKPTTICSSYRDKGFNSYNLEAGVDLAYDKFVYTGIACDVEKCVYNKYKSCEAEHVVIDSHSESKIDESHCHTYRPK